MFGPLLSRLRELAQALPRPGCVWEERPTFDPPASAEAVAALEQAAGFALPADVWAFLTQTGTVVAMSVHNGYWLGGAERLAKWVEIEELPRRVAGERIVPIGSDGGGNAFLLSAEGRVYRWNHETGNVSEVAASFTGFLERVAADWAAYVTNVAGWRFLV